MSAYRPTKWQVPSVRMNAIKRGCLYVWKIDRKRYEVVRLNRKGDGLITLSDHDEWYFAAKLIGKLYGPIYSR